MIYLISLQLMDDEDRRSVNEKKDEEDSPVLNIVRMLQLKHTINIQNRSKEM